MWKYCGSIFQLGIFIFLYYFSFFYFIFIHTRFSFLFLFFLFLVFLPHTSVHYLYLPFFYFLFQLKNIPATSHLLRIGERERERDCCSSAAPLLVEIEVTKRTNLVEIDVHHATLPRSSPHCCSSSSPPPGLVRLACYFLFLFFSYLLVLIQLYFKNWIFFFFLCFLFYVWIMWETERMRKKEIWRREKELI